MAINTSSGKKQAYLIKPRGGYDRLDFQFDDNVEVDSSCSLLWKNNYYVIGGWREKRQVSIVNGYRLKRVGSLDFNFYMGGCAVLNQVTVALCFDGYEKDLCRISNDPLGSYTKLPNSYFDHQRTRAAAVNGKNTSG